MCEFKLTVNSELPMYHLKVGLGLAASAIHWTFLTLVSSNFTLRIEDVSGSSSTLRDTAVGAIATVTLMEPLPSENSLS